MRRTSQHRVSLPDLPPSLRWESLSFGSATEEAIGFPRSRAPIGDLAEPGPERDGFPRFLADLGLPDRLPAQDLGVPRVGPVLLVATRPCGPVEGLLLGAILRTIRRDVRFLATQRPSEADGRLLFVDPFGRQEPLDRAPLRRALRWIRSGGLLVLFPSERGTSGRPGIDGPPENPEADLILRWTQPRAVPVYFAGPNGPLLRAVGRLHERLRAAPPRRRSPSDREAVASGAAAWERFSPD